MWLATDMASALGAHRNRSVNSPHFGNTRDLRGAALSMLISLAQGGFGSPLSTLLDTQQLSLSLRNRRHSIYLQAKVNMVFKTPIWMPQLSMDPPDSIPISDFMLDEKWGRHPIHHSQPPLTCGLTGAGCTMAEVKGRVNALARGISQDLGWKPNQGTEWEKVICVFSANTVRKHIIASIYWRSQLIHNFMHRLIP